MAWADVGFMFLSTEKCSESCNERYLQWQGSQTKISQWNNKIQFEKGFVRVKRHTTLRNSPATVLHWVSCLENYFWNNFQTRKLWLGHFRVRNDSSKQIDFRLVPSWENCSRIRRNEGKVSLNFIAFISIAIFCLL